VRAQGADAWRGTGRGTEGDPVPARAEPPPSDEPAVAIDGATGTAVEAGNCSAARDGIDRGAGAERGTSPKGEAVTRALTGGGASGVEVTRAEGCACAIVVAAVAAGAGLGSRPTIAVPATVREAAAAGTASAGGRTAGGRG